jgi:hypothetical protein
MKLKFKQKVCLLGYGTGIQTSNLQNRMGRATISANTFFNFKQNVTCVCSPFSKITLTLTHINMQRKVRAKHLPSGGALGAFLVD